MRKPTKALVFAVAVATGWCANGAMRAESAERLDGEQHRATPAPLGLVNVSREADTAVAPGHPLPKGTP
jgi:hypothetical protein